MKKTFYRYLEYLRVKHVCWKFVVINQSALSTYFYAFVILKNKCPDFFYLIKANIYEFVIVFDRKINNSERNPFRYKRNNQNPADVLPKFSKIRQN